jgi:hypothetical protein
MMCAAASACISDCATGPITATIVARFFLPHEGDRVPRERRLLGNLCENCSPLTAIEEPEPDCDLVCLAILESDFQRKVHNKQRVCQSLNLYLSSLCASCVVSSATFGHADATHTQDAMRPADAEQTMCHLAMLSRCTCDTSAHRFAFAFRQRRRTTASPSLCLNGWHSAVCTPRPADD